MYINRAGWCLSPSAKAKKGLKMRKEIESKFRKELEQMRGFEIHGKRRFGGMFILKNESEKTILSASVSVTRRHRGVYRFVLGVYSPHSQAGNWAKAYKPITSTFEYSFHESEAEEAARAVVEMWNAGTRSTYRWTKKGAEAWGHPEFASCC